MIQPTQASAHSWKVNPAQLGSRRRWSLLTAGRNNAIITGQFCDSILQSVGKNAFGFFFISRADLCVDDRRTKPSSVQLATCICISLNQFMQADLIWDGYPCAIDLSSILWLYLIPVRDAGQDDHPAAGDGRRRRGSGLFGRPPIIHDTAVLRTPASKRSCCRS